jgi:hypothetical protein
MAEKTRSNWRAAAAAHTEGARLLGSHRLTKARLSPDSAVVLMLSCFFSSVLHRSPAFLVSPFPSDFSDLLRFPPSPARHDPTSLR